MSSREGKSFIFPGCLVWKLGIFLRAGALDSDTFVDFAGLRGRIRSDVCETPAGVGGRSPLEGEKVSFGCERPFES